MTSSAGGPEGTGLSPGEIQLRAVRGSLWTAAHAVLAAPTAFLANAVVARVLGPADYGTLAFLTLALALAMQLTHVGVSSGVTQWGAAAEARGDRRAADVLLGRSLGFHVLVQLPLLLVAVLVLAADEARAVQAALILSLALTTGLSSTSLSLTIENRTAAVAKVAIGGNLLIQAALVLAAVSDGTPAGVWAARSVAASILLPVNLLLLRGLRRRASLRLRLPRSMPAGFWRFSAFAWVAGLVSTLVFSRSEVLLLSALSTPEAVGLFALAFGLSAQITAPVDAVIGPLMPAVAGLLAAHQESARAGLLRAFRLSALAAGAVAALALPLFAILLPRIYGDVYAPAAGLFLVLGIASCLQSIGNPAVVFLQGRGRTDVILLASCVALVVDVVAAVALIPPYGTWGAVIASVLGYVTFFGIVARRELPVHAVSARDVIRSTGSFAVALVAAGIALGSARLVDQEAVAAGLALVVGGGVFLTGLRLTGTGLQPADVDAVHAALPPRLTRVGDALLRLLSGGARAGAP